jgi:putative transposase
MRKTGHVYGTLTIEKRPRFAYQFAPKFNCGTFLQFLKTLVHRRRRKIFLIIDNGPCHRLDDEGKRWLATNRRRIELHRLPPYSPEFNGIEGVWKTTKQATTHNRFFATVEQRDAALTATFDRFITHPALVAGHVARFL